MITLVELTYLPGIIISFPPIHMLNWSQNYAQSVALAGIIIRDDTSLYVPLYTASTSSQKLMSGYIVSKAAMGL